MANAAAARRRGISALSQTFESRPRKQRRAAAGSQNFKGASGFSSCAVGRLGSSSGGGGGGGGGGLQALGVSELALLTAAETTGLELQVLFPKVGSDYYWDRRHGFSGSLPVRYYHYWL
jgi:hypothetical protein